MSTVIAYSILYFIIFIVNPTLAYSGITMTMDISTQADNNKFSSSANIYTFFDSQDIVK